MTVCVHWLLYDKRHMTLAVKAYKIRYGINRSDLYLRLPELRNALGIYPPAAVSYYRIFLYTIPHGDIYCIRLYHS